LAASVPFIQHVVVERRIMLGPTVNAACQLAQATGMDYNTALEMILRATEPLRGTIEVPPGCAPLKDTGKLRSSIPVQRPRRITLED
jgi:hypothetical protein